MWKLTSDQKQDVCSRYIAGGNAKSIGLAFGVSHTAVIGIVRRRGGVIRSNSESHRQKSLNEEAFSTVTEQSAHWAGFLMADGCVYRNSVALVLSEKDVAHVKQFKEFLAAEHAIVSIEKRHNKGGHTTNRAFRIEVKSEKIVSDLAAFGVVSRKTHTASALVLHDNRHFWRGVIGGDGWIGLGSRNVANNARLELVGSSALLEQFVIFVRAISNGSLPLVKPHKFIYRVGLSGKTASDVIFHVYDNVNVALARKMNAAINIRTAGLAGIACGEDIRLWVLRHTGQFSVKQEPEL